MRLIAVVVVLSLFVPLACELQSALSVPMPACEQSQPAPSKAPNSACCLLASLDRPVVKDLRQSNATLSAAVEALPPQALFALGTTARPSFFINNHEPTYHASPPKLYVLHAAFLI